jgi:hypothetical protein
MLLIWRKARDLLKIIWSSCKLSNCKSLVFCKAKMLACQKRRIFLLLLTRKL